MISRQQPPLSSTSTSAWHGVHRSNSVAAVSGNTSLPPNRRGRLKNGNRSGDFLAAPRCGALTRCGGSCCQPAMQNDRCRMHGGLSTGPRTSAGLARSRRARRKYGARSAEVRALLREARFQSRRTRALLTGSSAGHGVHRSNSTPTVPGISIPKVHHRAHRGHRETNPPNARAARNHSSSVLSVPSVVKPSSAGHGVDRRFSQPETVGVHPPSRSPLRRAKQDRRSSVVSKLLSAWHGVHRRFFARASREPLRPPVLGSSAATSR